MKQGSIVRYKIKKKVTPLQLPNIKFKLTQHADYVQYGKSAFDEYTIQEKYWTPQIISQTLFQAETGRIPVSGAGYGGAFAGEGFDSLWFDMSEIVRPTRDGIHGREYISTIVDLGRKLKKLAFENDSLNIHVPNVIHIPFPVIFNPLPIDNRATNTYLSVIRAAGALNTISILNQRELCDEYAPYHKNIALRIHKGLTKKDCRLIEDMRMVEIDHDSYKGKPIDLLRSIKDISEDIVCSHFLKASKNLDRQVLRLANLGAEIIHIGFSLDGRDRNQRAIPDVIRAIHRVLVKEKIRNELSIIVSGGIATAEHVPKSIICGADAVAIDYPLMIALGCGLWADMSYPCIAEHNLINPDIGCQRIINLMAAWRDQLLEILGAMGMREVRRLCGETGRAIFHENEERQFQNLFKKRAGFMDGPYSMGPVGDERWPADLIHLTINQARSGDVPTTGSYRVGNSGGGFDKLAFTFEQQGGVLENDSSIDLSIPLNKRGIGDNIIIPMPVYSGGMSYGSVSVNVMLARAIAAQQLDSFVSTGEGGYPEELIPYKNNIITQIATGLFGVSEETIKRAKIIEFKYAQGAKPGLGGHLLGGKVTDSVARARETVIGKSLFSPFPFHSVYSVEDHKKHIDWVKQVNPETLVIVKVSTPNDIPMVAIGSYYAGAHMINIDGSYGGTGAAPEISKKNIALPIEYAIPKVHDFLVQENVRDEIVVIASGGIRTAYDIAKAIALGADGVMVGTADLVALGCERQGVCEKGDGCTLGLTTTDPQLACLLDPMWGAQRIVNLRKSWASQLRQILHTLDMRNIRELRGRRDTLVYVKG